MADRPHFAFPFERGPDGKVKVVEQDSPAHIMSCENVIAHCPQGFRLDRPEFGVPWPEYRPIQRVTPQELVAAMRQFEPRSRLTGEQVADLVAQAQGEVTLQVEVET